MKQTPNYNLPQFEGLDKFTKEDFNDAFSKIDLGISDIQETINNTSGNGIIVTQEIIEARKGEVSLPKKIEKIDKSIETFVSPSNFNTLDEAIEYCKTNKKTLVANTIDLKKNTSFRGVALNIKVITLGGYTLELGSYNNLDNGYNPTQEILEIKEGSTWETDKVFIRGATGQTIKIGKYLGIISFRMNEDINPKTNLQDSRYIAYNNFFFGTVRGIDIKNDNWVVSTPSTTLWCNENSFYLNNVKKFSLDGTYRHNLNRIYGGCFEGVGASIDIKNGHSNVFKDIRFEGVDGGTGITVNFAKGTYGNHIYLNSENYYPKITDNGHKNIVSKSVIKSIRRVDDYSIKSNTFNPNYLNGFKNLTLTTDNLAMKTTATTLDTEVFESDFIDNPKSKMFTMECTLRKGRGFALKYRVYDENFNDISEQYRTNEIKLFLISSAKANVENGTEGAYMMPNSISGNISNGTGDYKNEKVVMQPTMSGWRDYPLPPAQGLPQVKYVKFFITHSSAYCYDSVKSEHAEYYGIRVYIDDLEMNYHLRYYNN